MSSTTLQLVRRPFDVLFHPSVIVETPSTYEAATARRKLLIGVKLVLFFVGNLLLYTFPLSIAGVGTVDPSTTAPAWFASLIDTMVSDPDAFYRFAVRLVENSLFLLVAALLTFAAVHVAVLITGQSNGILISLRVVTYSTALYLATLFTLVWYTAMSPNIVVADNLLLFLQAEFINFIIDWLGSDLILPGNYPTEVDTSSMTIHGQIVVVAILLTVLYYLYVLYLGVRAAHGTARILGVFVIAFVAFSPVLYVIGSILAVELAIAIPEAVFV